MKYNPSRDSAQAAPLSLAGVGGLAAATSALWTRLSVQTSQGPARAQDAEKRFLPKTSRGRNKVSRDQ